MSIELLERIAALLLRLPTADEPPGTLVVRVLAITPEGRRLLRRARNADAPASANDTTLDARSG